MPVKLCKQSSFHPTPGNSDLKVPVELTSFHDCWFPGEAKVTVFSITFTGTWNNQALFHLPIALMISHMWNRVPTVELCPHNSVKGTKKLSCLLAFACVSKPLLQH